MILAAPREISAPTGTNTPTELASEGTRRNKVTIKISGASASFQFLLIYTTARPPNNAGRTLSKAGVSTGEFKIGVSTERSKTPAVITAVVTIELVAMAIVEMAGLLYMMCQNKSRGFSNIF